MIVTIFTTISQKGDLGEDFDEDPLRHAFHDRFGPKPGGGPRGPEGYRRPPGPFQEISRAGRRASEDGLELLDCMGSLSACERAEDCPSRRVWGGLQVAIGDYLSGLTLADVASSAAAANL